MHFDAGGYSDYNTGFSNSDRTDTMGNRTLRTGPLSKDVRAYLLHFFKRHRDVCFILQRNRSHLAGHLSRCTYKG